MLRLGEYAHNTLEAPPYFIKLRGVERDALERQKANGDNLNWLASCRFNHAPR